MFICLFFQDWDCPYPYGQAGIFHPRFVFKFAIYDLQFSIYNWGVEVKITQIVYRILSIANPFRESSGQAYKKI